MTGMEQENNKIITVDIEQEMKKSFLDYSMSVIVSRALPDVRDGLKPVHRRILYTMYENGLSPEKAYRQVCDTRRRRAGPVPTPMAMPRYTMPWCAWLRTSRCGIRWWTATETSVRWTATRRQPTDTPRPR